MVFIDPLLFVVFMVFHFILLAEGRLLGVNLRTNFFFCLGMGMGVYLFVGYGIRWLWIREGDTY